ncbi:MAG: flagellar biosynthetic protein FliO [Firmicutes bacterium]|nr:flagellar biosynthetic protein FliO [Bacillota bacterium]
MSYLGKNKLVVFLALLVLVSCCPTVLANAAEMTGEETLDQSEAKPFTGGAEFHPGRLVLKMLLGLVAVLILLFMLGKTLSGRFGLPSGSVRYLSVIDSMPLGSGKGLAVIQVGNKQYLLGIGGDRIDLLTELSDSDLAPPAGDSDFNTVLTAAQRGGPANWQERIQQQISRLRQGIYQANEGDNEG